MADVLAELQLALVALLRSNPTVSALLAERIHDRVPRNPIFPYVALGEDQRLPTDEDADCFDGAEIFTTLHVWSRPAEPTLIEAKNVIGAVIDTLLTPAAIALPSFAVDTAELRDARVFRDPDGVTVHGIITLRLTTHGGA